MEQQQTPLPPLVSNEQAKDMACTMELSQNLQESQIVYWRDKHKLIDRIRDIYEADRAKTREVVQALVDALWQFEGAVVYVGWDPAEREKHKAAAQSLALAQSQLQIEPKR